jgi:hypothetical protein
MFLQAIDLHGCGELAHTRLDLQPREGALSGGGGA